MPQASPDDAAQATRGRRLPFVIVPSWLLLGEISDRALRVYGILAHHADRDTRRAFPSRARIAELARCSTDTVDRAIRELETAGAIDVHRRKSAGGSPLSSIYVVHETPADDLEGGGRTHAAIWPQESGHPSRAHAAITRTNRATRDPRAKIQGQDRPAPIAPHYDPDETEARFRALTGQTI